MARLGTGVGRICGVVAVATVAGMAAAIRAALRETPTVELRLDWLTSDAERSKLLGWLRHHRPPRSGYAQPLRARLPRRAGHREDAELFGDESLTRTVHP